MWLEAGLYLIYIENKKVTKIQLHHCKALTKEEVINDCCRVLMEMGYVARDIMPSYNNGYDRWEVDIFYS